MSKRADLLSAQGLIMMIKVQVNDDVRFAPKYDFFSHWEILLYVKAVIGDTQIRTYDIEEIKPEFLGEQA